MDAGRPEATRDQAESAFTPILRRLFQCQPELLAATFVDREGECIDYVSALEPYDAKVYAAHVHMLIGTLRAERARAITGEPFALELVGSGREVWARQLGEEYALVVVLGRGFDRGELRDALARTSREFREEVGFNPPAWELVQERLSVRVRASPGWQYAPQGFSTGGVRVSISGVLGRWTEVSRRTELVCFRVRTHEGQELTLVHDQRTHVWSLRD